MKWLNGHERCDRARAWASLAPDGELSELERRLLRSHTRRCAGCAAYAAQVGAVVETIRAQPLVAPSRPLLRIDGPARRRARTTWRRQVERGFALAAVAGMGAVTIVLGTANRQDIPRAPGIQVIVSDDGATLANELTDFREARRQQLISQLHTTAPVSMRSGPQPL